MTPRAAQGRVQVNKTSPRTSSQGRSWQQKPRTLPTPLISSARLVRPRISCSQPRSQPSLPRRCCSTGWGWEEEWKEGALEGHKGADSRPRNPFPLIYSLGEAFSTPLPPSPAFRSLQLLPSPLASAGCNPHSPRPPSPLPLAPLQPSILT